MSNTALGRTETALLTNKSGGSVAKGDVIIVDTANASAFTTTTTSAYVSGRIGVVLEPNGIANNAQGLIAFGGYVPKINLASSASLGHLVATHTVAKQGTPHAAPQVAGDFAQVLGTGTSPAALLYGTVQLGGGSGAPTTSTYITTSTDAGLSAEKVLPYLANYNPDKAPGSPSASDDEFDDDSIGGGWTAVNTPDVAAENTFHGFLHLEDNDAVDAGYYEAFAPGAAVFSVAAKVNVAVRGGFTFAGIKVTDSSNTGLCFIGLQNDNANHGQGITGPTGGATLALGLGITETVYLLLTRDATTNYLTYISVNGITWFLVSSFSQSGTVARLHVFVNGQGGNTCEADFDFIRTFASLTKVIGATP